MNLLLHFLLLYSSNSINQSDFKTITKIEATEAEIF